LRGFDGRTYEKDLKFEAETNTKMDLDFGVVLLYSATFRSALPNTGYGNFENWT